MGFLTRAAVFAPACCALALAELPLSKSFWRFNAEMDRVYEEALAEVERALDEADRGTDGEQEDSARREPRWRFSRKHLVLMVAVGGALRGTSFAAGRPRLPNSTLTAATAFSAAGAATSLATGLFARRMSERLPRRAKRKQPSIVRQVGATLRRAAFSSAGTAAIELVFLRRADNRS